MSFIGQSLVLYLLPGVGVAGAVYLFGRGRRPAERWLAVALAMPFWPFYLPLLLSARGLAISESVKTGTPRDEMAAAIDQVDTELEAALASLDGWASDVLAREHGRLHELRNAWTTQAERIRDMDRLLALPEYSDPGEDLSLPCAGTDLGERLRHSRQARWQNIERLRQVRRRAFDELMGTLAWVRELVSMIHLAKFTGAPASRAEELVAQIAAAVEGLSEVTWKEEIGA
jgi:hypothetical protein